MNFRGGNEMDKEKYATCEECGSQFVKTSSKMISLCPECAHILYGYPNCNNTLKNGKCIHCGWDKSRSQYITSLLDNDET